ncbi:hypothetical protein Cgig2_028085 [Carnegiea gigantea]|uniref:Pentatricopeptide repeat-containing protein n=1 Tax=Carnegiea gigantea TaxID=171969 RepID=A0A9Q1KJX1_9CARY|nr:hypothetical protein Cgig2_028085 [Carnegiea gigantea]
MVFEERKDRSVVSWTYLVVGLAVNGFGYEAIELFKEMEMKGWMPIHITLVGVLYACSYYGMVVEGFNYFNEMKVKYEILSKIEHYGWMVDLLSRAERWERHLNSFILCQCNPVYYLEDNIDIAETARAKLLELEPKHCGDYVLLSNLYASGQRWMDV